MVREKYYQLIRFLEEELAVSASSIAFAERICSSLTPRHRVSDSTSLPMVLWQYGLVTIEQLDRIFDWLETA
ncbi:MAG: DUF2949 domain-containing protein [Oscillatoria sp. SIO1A7]|nr:DUF2949 domain-containing protein [Oscillatoria sp. SIO1A7]